MYNKETLAIEASPCYFIWFLSSDFWRFNITFFLHSSQNYKT